MAQIAADKKTETELERQFIEAVYTNNSRRLKRCIKRGVNPNVLSENYGMGALHLAAQRGDVVLGKTLLQCQGLNINSLSDYNRTALLISCIFRRKKFANFLLENGADPNIADTCKRGPLHMCIRFGAISIMTLLIKYGANINSLDDFEQTPLSLAVTDFQNIRAARILLVTGVNFQLESKRRLHVFFETILQCRCIDDIKLVELLLDFGVDINEIDPMSGRMCLHFVAITGYIPLAQTLCDRGAVKRIRDDTNRSPAMVARDYGNFQLHRFFVTGEYSINLLLLLKYVSIWKRKCAKPLLAPLPSLQSVAARKSAEDLMLLGKKLKGGKEAAELKRLEASKSQRFGVYKEEEEEEEEEVYEEYGGDDDDDDEEDDANFASAESVI